MNPKQSAKHVFSQGMILKGFKKKIFFKIGMWHSRPPSRPPPFMAKTILNFHFDYLNPSLSLRILTVLRKKDTDACLGHLLSGTKRAVSSKRVSKSVD